MTGDPIIDGIDQGIITKGRSARTRDNPMTAGELAMALQVIPDRPVIFSLGSHAYVVVDVSRDGVLQVEEMPFG